MHNTAQTRTDLEALAKLVEHERIVMLTTVAQDGEIQSKPMTVLEFDGDGCFWFLCEHNPQDANPSVAYQRVNLAVSNEGKSTFVSINGSGEILRDQRTRHRLWSRLAKPWFPDGPDSPTLAVLKVTPWQAEFWDAPDSRVVRALAMATSIAAGKPVGMGTHGVLHPQPGDSLGATPGPR